MDVIKREKPDHLAVAFDKGGANCEMISSEYKTSRRHTWSHKIAVPYIQDLLKAMHIPIIEVAGYEADDLIGTIAKQAEKQNQSVYGDPIKILLNWYPKIFSCINPLVWVMGLRFGVFLRF
jgi:DNA polymerase-1